MTTAGRRKCYVVAITNGGNDAGEKVEKYDENNQGRHVAITTTIFCSSFVFWPLVMHQCVSLST